MNDTFSSYNPIINFTFFIGAIALGMFFVHPAFLAASVILSLAYYLTIEKGKGIKLIFTLLPVFIALSLINPIFNTYGETVLFTYFSRPYTLEALCYGMVTAAMFVSVICWFASYNAVMTSDKFVYLFGKVIPSLSLIFTMVLRLIPNYQKKLEQIASARKCIGKIATGKSIQSVDNNTEDDGVKTGGYNRKAKRKSKMEKLEYRSEAVKNGLTIVGALTSWALEGAIITSDSMKSRGYGCAKRTNFAIYRFTLNDKLLLLSLVVMIAFVIYSGATGAIKAAFSPELDISPLNNTKTIAALVTYSVFLSVPTALNVFQSLLWKRRIRKNFNKRS